MGRERDIRFETTSTSGKEQVAPLTEFEEKNKSERMQERENGPESEVSVG